MLLGWVALSAALSLTGPLWDITEQLEAEQTKDDKAADDARCWCKSVQSTLDDRLRNSKSEIPNLKTLRDSAKFGNVRLRIEINSDQKAIAEHSSSLSTSSALNEKATASHAQEKVDTAKSLESLKDALKLVDKPSQAHGVLKGLQDSFAAKLAASKESEQTRRSQSKDLSSAKTDMLKATQRSLETKVQRLASEKVVKAQAESDMAAYEGQSEADYNLQGVLTNSCEKLAAASAERQRQRQQLNIALSEEKAKVANDVAMKAMSKVLLLKSKSVVTSEGRCAKVLETLGSEFQGDCADAQERAEETKSRADENLENARKSSRELMDVVAKSSQFQADMNSVLSNVFMNIHLAIQHNPKLPAALKTKLDAYGKQAQSDNKAAPALYNAVRTASKKSTMADMKVVTSLQMGAATAGTAVVEAKRCK